MQRATLLAPLLVFALVSAPGGVEAGRPTCGGRAATKWKPDFVASDGVAWFFADGDGRDVIVGTNGRDQVEGSGGADYVCTRDGDDTVNAYGHDDRVWGGPGADRIDGGEGEDTVKGGSGNDEITGGPEDDDLYGGGGDDGLSDTSGPSDGHPADVGRLFGDRGADGITVLDGDGLDTACSAAFGSWDGAAGDRFNPPNCR